MVEEPLHVLIVDHAVVVGIAFGGADAIRQGLAVVQLQTLVFDEADLAVAVEVAVVGGLGVALEDVEVVGEVVAAGAVAVAVQRIAVGIGDAGGAEGDFVIAVGQLLIVDSGEGEDAAVAGGVVRPGEFVGAVD